MWSVIWNFAGGKYMKKNKKTLVLALASILSAGALLGVVTSTQTGGVANIFAADNEDSYIWNHYKAVAPTIDSHGSKEFWANCSVIGDIRLEKPTKGIIKEGVDFSTTDYFKNLDKTDIRYLPKLENVTVAFDSNGGTAVTAQTVISGNAIAEPTAPTRAADEYYDAYTFDGWYLNGKKFSFGTVIEKNTTLIAKWKYGNTKSTNSDVWSKDNFATENEACLVTIDSAFNNICWDGTLDKVDEEKKKQYITEFGKTDNDGWMLNFNNTNPKFGTISLPKTNFKTLLSDGKIVTTEIGGFNKENNVYLMAGGNDTQIFANSNSDQSVDCLTRTSLTFYKDSKDLVHVYFVDTFNESPCSDSSRYGEWTLTEEEANGTASLKLHSTTDGNYRRYWLGKLRFASDERVYKDFSTGTGFTLKDADFYTYEAMKKKTGSPYGQWYSVVQPTDLAIGICGTNNTYPEGPSFLTFDKFNFNELLNNKKGIRFTIGAWNGGEYISFVEQGKEINLGLNGAKPDHPKNHTKESIENTWHNWQVTIDKVGMHVYNVFTQENFDLTLTEKQLSGEDSLVFRLAKVSGNRFFLLTNMMTYHI